MATMSMQHDERAFKNTFCCSSIRKFCPIAVYSPKHIAPSDYNLNRCNTVKPQSDWRKSYMSENSLIKITCCNNFS